MSNKVIDEAMFDIIDSLDDISQLSNDVSNNEEMNANLNPISEKELNDKLKNDLSESFNYDLINQQSTNDIDFLDDNKYDKLTTTNLENSVSDLSLIDHALTDEEIVKYLSLFSENDFQLIDHLDLDNTLQPCSSINSNATTVSTQETNEFRESLLNSDSNCADQGDLLKKISISSEYKAFEECETLSHSSDHSLNHDSTNLINQQNSHTNMKTSLISNQMNYNDTTKNLDGTTVTSMNIKLRDDQMDCQINQLDKRTNCLMDNQMNNQSNIQSTEQLVHNSNPIRNSSIQYNGDNQMCFNYYYSSSNQINQFQNCSTGSNSTVSSSIPYMQIPQQTNFVNNFLSPNCPLGSNIIPPNLIENPSTINYSDIRNYNSFTNSMTSSNYLANNEYFTYTECRDVNCPYTYCSRYNPYYNSNFTSIRNQLRESNANLSENFLANTSINMNLVDNQIVFNKQSNHVFNHCTSNQTNKTNKRSKRKQPKNEYNETIICNETTDFAFYTLEENAQLKKKRGRKRKTDVLEFN